MYGILIILGIIISAFIAEKIAIERNLNTETMWGGLLYLVIGGLFGGRIYHVLDFNSYYFNNINQIFNFRNGGMGLYGGVLGATILTSLYLKVKKEEIGKWTDIAAITVPLGQSIGRLGNMVNNELLPYAYYESVSMLLLFYLLFKLRNIKPLEGNFIYLYLIGYSLTRILFESTRGNVWLINNLSVSILISFILLVFSTIAIVYKLIKN